MATLALGLLLAPGCGPTGELVSEPVSDWSFVESADEVRFETRSGASFRFVATSPYVQDGTLYLHVSTIFTLADGALDELLETGALQVSIDGKLYELEATRLTESAEIDPLLPGFVSKQLGIDATGVRWDPESERYPGTQVRQWFFRLESPRD